MILSKLQRYARAKKDPAMALLYEADSIRKELSEEMTNVVLSNPRFMSNILQNVISEIHKIKVGNDGKTPQKGREYFTPDDIREVVRIVESRIHVPEDGDDGKDADENAIIEAILKKLPVPKDGYTPMGGVDYPTNDQIKSIVYTEVASLFALKPKDKDGISKEDVEKLMGKINQKIDWKEQAIEIARALETLKGASALDYYALKNLPDITKGKQRTLHRGGGKETYYYDLSDLTDGVLKTFTIPANSRIVLVRGTDAPGGIYRKDTDWTGSGTTTLTLTSAVAAPTQGATLDILYVV